MSDHEIYRMILQALEDRYAAELRELRVFVIDQLDKYLVKRSADWFADREK